jgi:hypothetical protein
MSDFFFGGHDGHLTPEAQEIAARHGADHVKPTPRHPSRRSATGPARFRPKVQGDKRRKLLDKANRKDR